MANVVLWVQGVLVPLLGPVGLFLVAFCDSSFLSLPEINDILVVTSSSAHPGTAWVYIVMTTLGSVAGCLVLWYLGRRGGEAFLRRRFGDHRVEQTRAAFHRWDVLALAIPAVLPPPMPFKIFVLSAGVFGFPLRRFAITIFVARGIRYVFWGVLGILYGDHALDFLRAADLWFADRAWILFAAGGTILALVAVLLLRRRAAGPASGGAR
jgi:membrane protein YqaA with SNARE-associated domain